MSAATLPSRLQRSRGRAAISFKRRGPATVIDRLYQQGCAKIRLPKIYGMHCPEAVLLNTAGGLTGGDRFEADVTLGIGTRATLTTQAAERIYRSSEGLAHVTNRVSVGADARCFWLPQETILFDGARVVRRFEADLAPTARLLMIESWMIGRHAMGERVHRAHLRDHWRIRRDGRLIFADGLRFDGDVQAQLDRPAVAQGQACFATLLFTGPEAGDLLEPLRERTPATAFDGLLIARLVAPSADLLRQKMMEIIALLGKSLVGDGFGLPRVWHC